MVKSMLLVLFLVAVVLAPTRAAVADTAKRPNILFLFADDWGRFASIYSEVNGKGGINDVVRTPISTSLRDQVFCSVMHM